MRCIALVLLAASWGPATAADLESLTPVYVWPMQSALDQYLAEELTSQGSLAVTVDPTLARAVMTDRIDQVFMEGLAKIFPMPGDEPVESGSLEEGEFRIERPPNRPIGRPEGTVFLVDVATREVVWSTFLGEIDSRPKKLHREAKAVVERLTEKLTEAGT